MNEKQNLNNSAASLREKINQLRGIDLKRHPMDEKKGLDVKKYTLDDLYKFIDDWCENKAKA
jgi:hypothetical protein